MYRRHCIGYPDTMMGTISVLLLASSASSGADHVNQVAGDIKVAQRLLEICYSQELLRTGGQNRESAETLLRAARAFCLPDKERLRYAWRAIPFCPPGHCERQTAAGIEKAEGVAVGELLRARAATATGE